jgi:hypothetical protein
MRPSGRFTQSISNVSLENTGARHQVARTFLANGITPAARKRALGKYAFETLPD